MDIVAAVVNYGNIAITVLVAVLVGLWQEMREQRRLEREARRADVELMVNAVKDQTEVMRRWLDRDLELRVDAAARRPAR